MTLADKFKQQRKADYDHEGELFEIVLKVDPNAVAASRDGRVVIKFSDGSEYTLGNNS